MTGLPRKRIAAVLSRRGLVASEDTLSRIAELIPAWGSTDDMIFSAAASLGNSAAASCGGGVLEKSGSVSDFADIFPSDDWMMRFVHPEAAGDVPHDWQDFSAAMGGITGKETAQQKDAARRFLEALNRVMFVTSPVKPAPKAATHLRLVNSGAER